MNKLQMLAGLLAGLFTKNPDLGNQDEILGALSDVEAEFVAVETTQTSAPVAETQEPSAPSKTATPVAEKPIDPVASVDLEALKAQFRADFQTEAAYKELKQKAEQWDAHQAAISTASAPAGDSGSAPSAQKQEPTIAQLEAKHKYI